MLGASRKPDLAADFRRERSFRLFSELGCFGGGFSGRGEWSGIFGYELLGVCDSGHCLAQLMPCASKVWLWDAAAYVAHHFAWMPADGVSAGQSSSCGDVVFLARLWFAFAHNCEIHGAAKLPMTPKIDPALHRAKKPDWIRVTLPRDPKFWSTKGLITDLKLHTVCEEAQCPNRWECWSQGTATFMIAGDRCTRACGFCAVKTAKPFALEADEPQRVAEATKRMGLNHIVITAVARDDVKDGGAEHFARTIEAVREAVPTITIEILVPDFNGKDEALEVVMKAKPHIFNHNLETVERLTLLVRSRAMYHRSLHVLKRAKSMAEELGTKCATKSGLMLGLGETETELFQAMEDLREHDVTVLTLGQYLRPSPQHLPVIDYIHPDTFENYKQIALKKGFRQVASAPLVRSSYHAADFKPEHDL
jgi:lipoic acid synthetase